MLDLILGPLGPYIAGAGAALVAWAAYALRLRKARQEGAQKVMDQAEKDYRDERQRQDDLDIGIGATDADRQRMLTDIANGRSAGKAGRR